jgi:hypothetical protein
VLLDYYTAPKSNKKNPFRFFEWLIIEEGLQKLRSEFKGYQIRANRENIAEEIYKQVKISWDKTQSQFDVEWLDHVDISGPPLPSTLNENEALSNTLSKEAKISIGFVLNHIDWLQKDSRMDGIEYGEQRVKQGHELYFTSTSINSNYQLLVSRTTLSIVNKIREHLHFVFPAYIDHYLSSEFSVVEGEIPTLLRIHGFLKKKEITKTSEIHFWQTLNGFSSDPIVWTLTDNKGNVSMSSIFRFLDTLKERDIITLPSSSDYLKVIRRSFTDEHGTPVTASGSIWNQYKDSVKKGTPVKSLLERKIYVFLDSL